MIDILLKEGFELENNLKTYKVSRYSLYNIWIIEIFVKKEPVIQIEFDGTDIEKAELILRYDHNINLVRQVN